VKLPNAGRALVEREKITEYLLNAEHSDNGGKARFFTAMGFRRDDWAALAAAFRSLALGSVAVQRLDSTHGEKYLVDGHIKSPSGRMPRVRTVWIVEPGQDAPRLVTAYPREEGEAL
jgi:hypothetical protein